MRRIFLAAYRHCSTPDNVARVLDAAYQPALQAAGIRDPDTLTLIVEQDGQWAGFAQLRWGTTPPPEIDLLPTVELGRVYLDAAFHGRGIAAQLVANLLAAAKVRGSRSVWLNVWQGFTDSLRVENRRRRYASTRSTGSRSSVVRSSRWATIPSRTG